MSLKTQAKVLRVLQEQVMERVGGTQRIKVDVRVLAATNKELPAEIRDGRFREDLYFRLNVIPIFVPPLRDRAEDIPLLAEHFMALMAAEYGRRPKRFAPEAMARLQHYAWPGNVRELRNIDRAADDHGRRATPSPRRTWRSSAQEGEPPIEPAPAATVPLAEAREQFERDYILRALAASAGQHVADRRCAGRRAQQSLQEDEGVRHRAAARRATEDTNLVSSLPVLRYSRSLFSSTWSPLNPSSCR